MEEVWVMVTFDSYEGAISVHGVYDTEDLAEEEVLRLAVSKSDYERNLDIISITSHEVTKS